MKRSNSEAGASAGDESSGDGSSADSGGDVVSEPAPGHSMTSTEPSSATNSKRNVRFTSPQRSEPSSPRFRDQDSVDDSQTIDLNGSQLSDSSKRRKWWPAMVEMANPSLILENSGSVARDHLASERTFLAYVRTSLAIASAGVALVQLFTISASQSNTTAPASSHIQRFARPLGAITVFMGLFVMITGTLRYFRIQAALINGKFPLGRHFVFFIGGFLSMLVTVVFGVLVAVPR